MRKIGTSAAFLLGDEMEWEIIGKGVKRKIMAYDDTIMLVNVHFDKGGIGAIHEHYHSQVTYVESGQFEVTIGGETKILKGGDSFYVQPHVLHGAICLESGILVDVFSPMREDFIK
jgi:quercetin dioxygenase-like cupin family protein